MRIMMSAAGSAVAPSIIRHLQSLGHYVIGHDCGEFGYGARVCDEFHLSPPARGSEYFWFLERFRSNIKLYLPFLDEELKRFSVNDRIENVFYSPNETIRIFTSKPAQQSAFVRGHLPIAPFEDSGRMICKPPHGRGGKGNIDTDNCGIADQLRASGWVTQRFIDGDEYTVDVLTDLYGAFLFAVPRLRIQANGVSVIGKIVMDADIIDLARLVVSKFAFRGPINIQIIRERDTGKLYIIELNPRLSGSCMFTVMAGFDILDATIKLWEGKPFVAPDKIDDGLVIRRHYVEERL